MGIRPKTAKKIKNKTAKGIVKGYTRDNIEWIKTYLFCLPPNIPEGFTEDEYWEYLDLKYGDYNSVEHMTKRAGLYKEVIGKPCAIAPKPRPSMKNYLSEG